jgi:hypothetical protein
VPQVGPVGGKREIQRLLHGLIPVSAARFDFGRGAAPDL